MDSFNFEILMNHCMVTVSIKPPNSFSSLVEIAQEKYDLTKINKFLYADQEDDEEIKISNDSEYLQFLDHVDKHKLKEIEIIIKSDESKNRRKTSMRKWSNIKPPVTRSVRHEENCINDNYDQDYDRDMRNNKYLMEEGLWSNQSKNTNETRRIYYIKEKKEMLRMEQMQRELVQKESMQIDEEEDEEDKNRRKRVLKSQKKNNIEIVIDDNEKKKKNGKNRK